MTVVGWIEDLEGIIEIEVVSNSKVLLGCLELSLKPNLLFQGLGELLLLVSSHW